MQAEVSELVALRRAIAIEEQTQEERLAPLKSRRDALQAHITEELKKTGVYPNASKAQLLAGRFAKPSKWLTKQEPLPP
jgi:hypothetical protein